MLQSSVLVNQCETSIQVTYCKDRKHNMFYIDDNTELYLMAIILNYDTLFVKVIIWLVLNYKGNI
jgi:hypothetical protein